LNTIFVRDQTGSPRPFIISGDTPTAAEQTRIDQAMAGVANPPKPAAPEPGIIGSLGAGIARGFNEMQAGTDLAAESAANGLGAFLGYSPQDWHNSYEGQLKERDQYYAGPQGDFTSQSPYDMARTLAGTIGNTGLPMAGTIGLSLTGIGALPAIGIGTAMYAPQMLSQNVEQQEQVKGKGNIDWTKAALATGGQSLIESFTDRVTLGIAGLTSKAVPSMIKDAIAAGTKDGLAAAAKHVGTTAAVGALNGAAEEATQQALQRWQADQDLTSPEAMKEYVQNAVVGAILEGSVGGIEGGFGASAEHKYHRSQEDAKIDAQAERDRLQRRASVTEPEKPAAPDATFAGLLEDHSGPSTEQLALQKNTAGVPITPPNDQRISMPNRETPKGFTEDEYVSALEAMRGEKSVASDKIKNTMKIGRSKADAIFDEMLRRNDAEPTGSAGQYLRVTTPKGIATRENSNASGRPGTEREYAVQPVDDTARTPYSIQIGERKIGNDFQTHEQAQNWAIQQGLKKFEIKNDTAGQQFGIYEKHYTTDENGQRQLVGNRVVNTFATAQEANTAAAQYDPKFSPATNEAIAQVAARQQQAEVKAQIDKPLQQFVDNVLGVDRAKVDVQDKIDNPYLRSQGVGIDTTGRLIEGVAMPRTENMPQTLAAAKQLTDPNNQANDLKEIVGGHELVHAIRNSDLLKPAEWNKLIDFAARTKVPGKTYTFAQWQAARAPQYTDAAGNPSVNTEEIIAEMFRHYVRNPLAFDKSARPFLQRIKDFLAKFLRLAKDDGSDIMRAIYGGKIADRPEGFGGLGPRTRDVFFSNVRVDPFYSKAFKFFNETKQEKASPEQWMGMVKNSGIKQDELNWLDLDNWFKAWGNQPVPKSEITKYIAASGLQVSEKLRSVNDGGRWTPEDEATFGQDMRALAHAEAVLKDQYRMDVNHTHYMLVASDPASGPYKSWFNHMLEAYAADGDQVARDVLDERKRLEAMEQRRLDAPRFEGTTQPGGDEYGELVMYLPELKPVFKEEGHWHEPNVIGTTRFKTRRIGDQKTLFIEEVQSDLHQRGAKNGYSKPGNQDNKRYDELLEEKQGAEERIAEINEELGNLSGDVSYAANRVTASQPGEDRTQATAHHQRLLDKHDALIQERNRLRSAVRGLVQGALWPLEQRFNIPDAPLKSTWEEFVLKRMIRYAAENDFDSISWHGEPQSVADTENYGNLLTEETPVRTRDAGRGTMDEIFKAREAAYDAGDQAAVDAFDAGIKSIIKGQKIASNDQLALWQKYLPAKTTGGVQHFVGIGDEKYDRTPIVNRYLEKMPRIAKQIGKKFGSIPYLYDPAMVERVDPETGFDNGFIAHFDNIYDVQSLLAAFGGSTMPSNLEKGLNKLMQIMHQRGIGTVSPRELSEMQEKAGIDNKELNDFIKKTDEIYGGLPDDVPRAEAKTVDENGNVDYKRWIMPLTEELRDSALHVGFPLFSAVNPNDEGFAEGTKIIMPPVIAGGDDDSFDAQMPSLPSAKFSAVPSGGKYEAMVNRDIQKMGYTPILKQKLAKAKIFDGGMTPYGRPLEEGKPDYVDQYVLRVRPDGQQTPIFGTVVNPLTNKKEPVVIRAGGDWIPEERGISWPSGYGFNHSVWHHPEIAKDLGVPNDRTEMLKLFARSIANGGEMEMQKDNRGSLVMKRPEWRRPLRIVVGRSMIQDKFFKTKQPVWDFITAFTNYGSGDAQFSSVPLEKQPKFSDTAPFGLRVQPTVPQDTLATVEAKMTYNNLVPAVGKLFKLLPEGQKAKANKVVESSFIALQDRMLSVGDLIDHIKANGGMITNDTDTYLREQLFAGQVDDRLREHKKAFYNPLINAVSHLDVSDEQYRQAKEINEASRYIIQDHIGSKGLGIAELYLYAQHAQERNAVMRDRNERLQDQRPEQYEAGSGMSDQEAQEILNWVNRQSFARNLSDASNPASVRSLFRKVIGSTNDVRVNAGLNPDFRANGMDPYQDYAPLRGWVEEHVDDDADVREFARAGRGYRVMGKEDRSALGRRSLAGDIIGHAVLQNEEAIVRAGKNAVSQSFANMVRENAQMMRDTAEIIGQRKMTYVFDRRAGRVRRAVDNSMQHDDSVLVAKFGGDELYVKIKDPRIAKAMNQRASLGNNGTAALTRALLTINRFLAATRTSLNPEFMISNFLKDFDTALSNMTELEVQGLRRAVIRDIIPALQGVREGVRKETANSVWGKAYAAFKKRGGQTAYYGIRELSDTIAKMNKELSQDVGGGNLAKSKHAIGTVFKFIEDYNTVIENGVRVATFKNLRDKFVTDENDPVNVRKGEERAAFIAKNLTVNFNMGGDLKPVMNAWYLFFNAGLQGSMAMINPLVRSPRVRRLWASVLVAGALQDMLMSMLFAKDDDGISQYDKIPEYVLQNNVVLADPFGLSNRGYFKIPMPYLMNSIWNAGRVASAAVRGHYTPGKAVNSMLGPFIESINPWGGSNSFANFVAPTIADPIVDLIRNENFAGNPIAPPPNPYGGDEKASQRYWNNTSPLYVSIADWMSRLSGSSGNYLPGAVEASPNQVEYLMEWVGGGTATFVRRAWDLLSPVGSQDVAKEMANGGDWSANDVPGLRRFYGNITSRNDLQYYIDNRDRVLAVGQELKSALKEGDSQHYQEVMQAYPKEYKMYASINAFENARKKISHQIKKVQDSKLPDDKKGELVRTLKQQQDSLVGRANGILRQL
jgi:hypothetical protein